jgi:hypothetical protein
MEITRTLPRRLNNDLLLRVATPQDVDRLAEFNARIHSDDGPEKPDDKVAAWTRDLMSEKHPTFLPSDFTIIEDTQTKQIVSSLNLISQTWSYGGIEFLVGRPELVGTLPEYRRQGLVRVQMEEIHRWSAQRGEVLQAITGIPHYYRQFGYEMCLDLEGSRTGFAPQVPILEKGTREPYSIRPAREKDLPFMLDVYASGQQRSLVQAVWSLEMLRHELLEKSPKNFNRQELLIIERAFETVGRKTRLPAGTTAGEPVGFLAHAPFLWGPAIHAMVYELKPGMPWTAVTPSVIRYLWRAGQQLARKERHACDGFTFSLGANHPVYQTIPGRLPQIRKPYAFYIRIPDLPGFIRLITPVLEGRLRGSVCAGYTGELKLSFYHSGLKLVFREGRLVSVDPWEEMPTSPPENHPDAAFPGLTFYQVLFGYRSLDEIRHAFADCWVNDDRGRPLLEALFPSQPSDIWPIS